MILIPFNSPSKRHANNENPISTDAIGDRKSIHAMTSGYLDVQIKKRKRYALLFKNTESEYKCAEFKCKITDLNVPLDKCNKDRSRLNARGSRARADSVHFFYKPRDELVSTF